MAPRLARQSQHGGRDAPERINALLFTFRVGGGPATPICPTRSCSITARLSLSGPGPLLRERLRKPAAPRRWTPSARANWRGGSDRASRQPTTARAPPPMPPDSTRIQGQRKPTSEPPRTEPRQPIESCREGYGKPDHARRPRNHVERYTQIHTVSMLTNVVHMRPPRASAPKVQPQHPLCARISASRRRALNRPCGQRNVASR